MYNILFIVTKSETGGAQKFVYEQIEILSDKYNCYLATNAQGWLTDKTKDKVKDSLLSSSIEGPSLLYLISLRNFIKVNNIDLIVCNSANAGLYGRLAAFFTRKKSIYVSHGWSSIYNGGKLSFLYNAIEKLLSYITNSILCVSKNDYLIAQSKLNISPYKLRHINNAIIPFSSNIPIFNKDLKKYKLLSVARLAHPKRLDLLIQAVGELGNVELTIVGYGPDLNNLLSIVNSKKIDNVHFAKEIKGFRDFDKYDFFALISDSEGLPMSAIEAMSFGLPLILSKVGGCPQLINNSGILVNNDINSIRGGIVSCLHNLNEFSKNSFNLYQDEFNLIKKANIFKEYYQSVINNN